MFSEKSIRGYNFSTILVSFALIFCFFGCSFTKSKPVNSTVTHQSEIPNDQDEIELILVLERMPEIIGGYSSFLERFHKEVNLVGLITSEARVIFQFLVNESGEVNDLVLVRGINSEADLEIIRAFTATIGKFTPATQRDKPVSVLFNLPIQIPYGE